MPVDPSLLNKLSEQGLQMIQGLQSLSGGIANGECMLESDLSVSVAGAWLVYINMLVRLAQIQLS